MAAALGRSNGDGRRPGGQLQRWSLDQELGMHVAHEGRENPEIEMNSLPRCRRVVDRKPHIGGLSKTGDARNTRKLGDVRRALLGGTVGKIDIF